jgi:hypothetical protein
VRLILIGSEYAGKTTLGEEIGTWWKAQTGALHAGFHDHFVVPHLVHVGEQTEAEEAQIEELTPSLLEKFQRYNIEYHLGTGFIGDADHWLIDWFYADAVYAPLYYGYGGRGEYSDRQMVTRWWEADVIDAMPDMILVLVKASPEAIKQRICDNPHPKGVLKEKDVELVLQRYKEEFTDSHIRRKFELDTTNATVEETLQEFVRQIEPLLTDSDRLRIITHYILHRPAAL